MTCVHPQVGGTGGDASDLSKAMTSAFWICSCNSTGKRISRCSEACPSKPFDDWDEEWLGRARHILQLFAAVRRSSQRPHGKIDERSAQAAYPAEFQGASTAD